MDDFTYVIPAWNEATTIAPLVNSLLRSPVAGLRPRDVVVVDNGSDDATAALAREAGARVVVEPRRGKGFAVLAGARVCRTSRIMLCDGDIQGFEPSFAEELNHGRRPGEVLARIALERPAAAAPVTLLTARPLLVALGHGDLQEPIGGLALVARQLLLEEHLPGGWGFDIALTLSALRCGRGVREDVRTGISHRTKPIGDYADMARDVCVAALRQSGRLDWDHLDCCHLDHRSMVS